MKKVPMLISVAAVAVSALLIGRYIWVFRNAEKGKKGVWDGE